jgi:hypothetical protein
MEKEYKAMMEQVHREGEMMKGRAMINTKILPPLESIY